MNDEEQNIQEDDWGSIPTSHFTPVEESELEQLKHPHSSSSSQDSETQHGSSDVSSPSPPQMSFDAASTLLMNLDTSKGEVKLQPPKRFLCFGPPDLDGAYLDQVIQFLSLAKTPVQNVEETQAMLFAFYSLMTGNSSCAPHGSHWEPLGFQGNDPRTDFRSCGILSLYQMFYFATEEKELALKILHLSQLPETSFPFAVISINITSFILEAIRQSSMNKILNKTGNVFPTLNQAYVATKSGKKTIHDCSDVLAQDPDSLIAAFLSAKNAGFPAL